MSARHRKHKLKIRGAEQEVRRLDRLEEAYESVASDLHNIGLADESIPMRVLSARRRSVYDEAKRMHEVVADLERSMAK